MNNPKKTVIIGAGKMGEAIISGLLKSRSYRPQDIRFYEVLAEQRENIARKYNVKPASNVDDAVGFGDIVIVAVKPGVIGKVLEQIREAASSRKVIVSIAAGVTVEYMRAHLSDNVAIVRVMPNLACSVGEAMIVACCSEETSEKEFQDAIDVFSHLGRVLKLEEKYLNLATGLVGSGPAYIFLIIDALADAGVRLGLPKKVSTVLAAQTTLGAAKMVMDSGEHPAKLKDMVATPAGTTVEGLLALEQGRLRSTLISAVTEAAKKAKGLLPA